MTPSGPDPRLDDIGFLRAHDPADMLELIEQFPGQFVEKPPEETGSGAAPGGAIPPAFGRRRLWIAAMGGSAFAGDMTALALPGALFDVSVVRSYALPASAANGDLLLALSYSGNTAETLDVFAEAGRRGLSRLAVTSGGELGRRAAAEHVPCAFVPAGYPPRAAAGFAWSAAVRLLGEGGFMAAVASQLSRCRGLWGPGSPGSENEAKRIASALHERYPVMYGGTGAPEAALLRWRTQINENAKTLCHTAALPEMNHNEIVGWTDPAAWRDRAIVLFLDNCGEDAETARRLAITRDWLARRGVVTLSVSGEGADLLQTLWWLCHLGDYVSLYLAALRQVDPTPVPAIDELKQRLAEEHP